MICLKTFDELYYFLYMYFFLIIDHIYLCVRKSQSYWECFELKETATPTKTDSHYRACDLKYQEVQKQSGFI